MLAHPSVGAWARQESLLLRRPGGGALARPATLATVVVAAAVHAGVDAAVPVADQRGGDFPLPSLGVAHLPPTGGEVEVVAGGGGTSLRRGGGEVFVPEDPHQDVPGWRGLRRIDLGAVGFLLDPWAHVHLPAELRAGADAAWPLDVEQWCDRLAGGWAVLTERHPEVAAEVAAAVGVLTPLGAAGGPTSVTLADGFGCVFLSLPVDDRAAAETLAHELQHAKLTVVLDLFPLVASDPGRLFYAPWRDDARPLLGVLHGTYAHLGVTAFWRRERGLPGDRAEVEFIRWRIATLSAAGTLLAEADLTPMGRFFVERIAETLRGWGTDEVSADAVAAAEAMSREHRATWLAANAGVATGSHA